MAHTDFDFRAHKWGLASIGLGGIALIITSLVIFAGPFAPQQSIGSTIGEIIGDISASAFNTARGQDLPPPEAAPWDIDRVLMITGPVLAILAIISAIVSAFKHDPKRMPTYGAALGVAAISMQFIWWIVMIILGVILLVSVIENGPGFLEL